MSRIRSAAAAARRRARSAVHAIRAVARAVWGAVVALARWLDEYLLPPEKVMYAGLVLLVCASAALLDWAALPPMTALAVPGLVMVFVALRRSPPKGG